MTEQPTPPPQPASDEQIEKWRQDATAREVPFPSQMRALIARIDADAARLANEKSIRIGYQDLVYKIANELDASFGFCTSSGEGVTIDTIIKWLQKLAELRRSAESRLARLEAVAEEARVCVRTGTGACVDNLVDALAALDSPQKGAGE